MSDFDQIFIEDIKCYATIGINKWEKQTKQPLVVSLTLDIKKMPRNNKDKIYETIDYKELVYKIKNFVENSNYELIETLGKEVAYLCLENAKVYNAKIKIDKLKALKAARSVGVIIYRSKNEN